MEAVFGDFGKETDARTSGRGQSSRRMPNILRSTLHRQRGLFQITTFMSRCLLLSSQQYDTKRDQTGGTEEDEKGRRDQRTQEDADSHTETEHSDEIAQTVHRVDHTPYTAV